MNKGKKFLKKEFDETTIKNARNEENLLRVAVAMVEEQFRIGINGTGVNQTLL
jgi:hypothetical protein